MAEARATLLDWSQVKSAIGEFRNSLDLPDDSIAFSYFALSKILKIDDAEISATLMDGPDDRGIDAVYIDSRPEARRIHLFQFKHVSDFKKTQNNFPSNEVDKISTFLDDCFRQDSTMEGNCNPLLWLKVQAIWSALEESVYSIHIHLCSNASKLTEQHSERFREGLRPYLHAQVSEHDLMWFSNAISRASRDDRRLALPIVENQLFGRTDGFAQGLIATVRASDLVDLIREPEYPSEVDPTLFEENIRLYLGEENEVNRKILTTALSKNNLEFWYLNNGVTIVCQGLEYQPKSASPKAHMINPQIVNGGQTSHALFEAGRSDILRIADVRILVRIIETTDQSLTMRVAEATNSQTPIRSRDIRSNDKVQVQLENALRPIGYFYERKNDQHIGEATDKRIDAVKLGQVILAYVLREPDRAKTASNKIFGEYYEWVFNEHVLSAENVLAIWRIYKTVEDDRQRMIKQMSGGLRKRYDEAWIIEGVFHILYMLSLKTEASGGDIFDAQQALSHYEDVKNEIDKFVDSQRGTAAYRIFRSAYTKGLLAKVAAGQQLNFEFPRS
ncbi:AIPR family protein [Qipengyuania sp. YIM B01966]|uniref:AIPR family protein n=1 Tax=Qipengyuania sp. YIM B01966 TaxID=2778646 RepID=UPI0018F3BE41|nr:AIPR family protein [Qipengyuania sp. YIM B01966]